MFVVSLGLKPESSKHRTKGRASSSIGRFKIPVALSRYGAIAIIVLTIGAGVLWMGADPVIRRVERTELSLDGASKEPGRETFCQSRGWIWRDTLALIRANWVTGIGLGAYQTVFPMYSKRDGAILVSQAHNDYLQALADGGIVAALLTVWFLFLSFRDIG